MRTDSHRAPKFSISQVSTLAASFADDVRVYAEGGVDAIGIWELKLGDAPDDEELDLFRQSGLGAATAVPLVPSIHPLPLLPGPDDPRERIDGILRSLNRLAAFEPAAILCFTGPGDGATVVEGLREIGAEAERLGVRVALEPFQCEGLSNWSIVNTIGDAVELLEEVGSPAFGIQFDVWHLWNTPDLYDEIERHSDMFVGVHVSDWREPMRGWADRVLPGEGIADVPGILGALDRAGWDGYYDIEIFSDNGSFGAMHPDSLWDLDPAEFVRRSRESFTRSWEDRLAKEWA